MEQTREDYIRGVDLHVDNDGRSKKSKYRQEMTPEEKAQARAACRKSIEHWLRNDGQKLMMIYDPEAVIEHLRKLARKYEAERAR